MDLLLNLQFSGLMFWGNRKDKAGDSNLFSVHLLVMHSMIHFRVERGALSLQAVSMGLQSLACGSYRIHALLFTNQKKDTIAEQRFHQCKM